MDTTAITAAFMSAGLHSSYETTNAILEHWGSGHIELVSALMSYLPYTVALMDAAHKLTGDYPGVPDYEISEEFGAWFGAEIVRTSGAGVVPDPASCYGELRRLVYQFFHTDPDPDNVNEELMVLLLDLRTDTASTNG